MMTQGQSRSKLLVKNVMASFAVKGWSALIVLLMVPLTLKMLGVYLNGAWLAISGVLVWIDLMDIGLGNGLRNAVAEYIAHDDTYKVKEAVSSTFFMLAVTSFGSRSFAASRRVYSTVSLPRIISLWGTKPTSYCIFL